MSTGIIKHALLRRRIDATPRMVVYKIFLDCLNELLHPRLFVHGSGARKIVSTAKTNGMILHTQSVHDGRVHVDGSAGGCSWSF